ncbi:MAG: hypothetical protein EOP04_11785, partial [Proteobacteria bacterium]
MSNKTPSTILSVEEVDLDAIIEERNDNGGYKPSPDAWEDETLYFLLLDRFSDGKEDCVIAADDESRSHGERPLYNPAKDAGNAVKNEKSATRWRDSGKTFTGGNLRGLTDYIEDRASLEQSVVVHQSTGLHLLLCTKPQANPLELLVSDRFADKVSTLRSHYDHIIIDTPPVQIVSDPVAVASLADGVLYVVKAESTPASTVLSGMQRLEESGVRAVEIIINQVDPRRAACYDEYGFVV